MTEAVEHDEEWGEPFDLAHRAEPTMGVQVPGPHTMRVHKKGDCKGEHCVIHNPSDHKMVSWPLNWRGDRALMERICEHGIGHPDPDDIEYKRLMYGDGEAYAESVHGCDGCCVETSGGVSPTVSVVVTDVLNHDVAANVLRNHIKRALYQVNGGEDFTYEISINGDVVAQGSKGSLDD